MFTTELIQLEAGGSTLWRGKCCNAPLDMKCSAGSEPEEMYCLKSIEACFYSGGLKMARTGLFKYLVVFHKF